MIKETKVMDTALILEGGGFRAMYGAGVLDVMQEAGIMYPYVIGVSMGAVNGGNYIARQPGRSIAVIRDYMKDPRYMGVGNLVKEGNLFGHRFAYHELPRRYITFDIKTYYESDERMVMVATNTATGQATYFDKYDYEMCEICGASTALPFCSRMVSIKGEKYLDGGLADSVPINHVLIKEGYRKAVLVLTRPKDYRKEPYGHAKMVRQYYRRYPKLAEAILNRHIMYNQTMDRIDQLEASGQIFVLRPEVPIDIKVLDKSTDGVLAAYEDGRILMKNKLPELRKFLELA